VSFAFRDPNHGWVSYGGYNSVHPATQTAVPGHVFEVTWDGISAMATFTLLDGTGDGALGDLPVNTLVRDDATGDLFVGTDFGVLRRDSKTGHWKHAVLSKAAADSFEFPDTAALLDALENPEIRFTGNAAEQRDRLLRSTLASAYNEMENLQGSDPKQWRWGKLHSNLSEHPLYAIVDEATRSKLNVGPFEMGGGAYTPNVAHYHVTDFRDSHGPSLRVVVDLGNWDNSRAMNYPGQSGDPDSPHYRDLATRWRTGQYVPLLYSRKAVEAATEKRIQLLPQTTQP
jgi:hypothetical protein